MTGGTGNIIIDILIVYYMIRLAIWIFFLKVGKYNEEKDMERQRLREYEWNKHKKKRG